MENRQLPSSSADSTDSPSPASGRNHVYLPPSTPRAQRKKEQNKNGFSLGDLCVFARDTVAPRREPVGWAPPTDPSVPCVLKRNPCPTAETPGSLLNKIPGFLVDSKRPSVMIARVSYGVTPGPPTRSWCARRGRGNGILEQWNSGILGSMRVTTHHSTIPSFHSSHVYRPARRRDN